MEEVFINVLVVGALNRTIREDFALGSLKMKLNLHRKEYFDLPGAV